VYYSAHGNLSIETIKENQQRPDAIGNVGCAWRTRKLNPELDEAPWQHQGRTFPIHPAAAYKASPQNRVERKTGGEKWGVICERRTVEYGLHGLLTRFAGQRISTCRLRPPLWNKATSFQEKTKKQGRDYKGLSQRSV